MTENLYPLLFVPIYKDYLWGGNRIGAIFNRTTCPSVCAESWEISDRQDGMSVIANGIFSGATIRQVIERMPEAILGADNAGQTVFPLLIKIIDANQRLSLQVHPDDRKASELGGEAKTEMWYILSASQGSKVFAGFNRPVDEIIFEHALKNNNVENLLKAIPVSEGDAIYLPGGTIHAIGEGCMVLEVQQNSNTTYRAYDWNRMDKSGKPRELHIAKAMKTINWKTDDCLAITKQDAGKTSGNAFQKILSSPFFTVSKIELSESETIKNSTMSFHIVFITGDPAIIEANRIQQVLPSGTTCLIPASINEYRISPARGKTTLVHFTRPVSQA